MKSVAVTVATTATLLIAADNQNRTCYFHSTSGSTYLGDSAVTTTNDVTVGANVNISTVPTLPIHATNKSYVDTRALALAVAMS